MVTPWRGKLRDFGNGGTPLAYSLSFVGVGASGTDLARDSRKKISLLDVATLAGAVHHRGGSAGIEGDRWQLPPNEPTKLRPPLSRHAANGPTTRRVASKQLSEPANGNPTKSLSIAAATRWR
jgi:hypothetical protein